MNEIFNVSELFSLTPEATPTDSVILNGYGVTKAIYYNGVKYNGKQTRNDGVTMCFIELTVSDKEKFILSSKMHFLKKN